MIITHYVTSDIHGDARRWRALLNKIRLGPDDKLYVIGDVADRGTEGVPILREILSQNNIILLMGNHEQMLLNATRPDATDEDIFLWHYNGGSPTGLGLQALRRAEGEHAVVELRDKIQALPDQLEVEIGGRTFHLVHACPGEDHETRIWRRPEPQELALDPKKTFIIGHTNADKFKTQFEALGDAHTTIYRHKNLIAIDCGSGFHSYRARLACLRLEDMTEYYF